MKLFPAVRTLIYVAVFVIGWTLAVSVARRFDPAIGVELPSWLVPVGYVLFALGAALTLVCVSAFVFQGHGTPAPFDAPQELVVWGPYRFVRNPIYVGLVSALVGVGFVLRSVSVLVLAALVWLLAHLLVVFYEEPTLRRRFGESYERYTRNVNRWMPRRPREQAH